MPGGISMAGTGATVGATGGSLAGPIGSIGGALIGGGLGLAGSLLSSKSGANRRWQREQMQNAIQWRVADAKKAGIHPLYAMGANIQSPSPIEVNSGLGEGLQAMGQAAGQLSNRFQMQWERNQTAAQIRVLNTEALKNEAMASFYRSQAMNPQPSSAPAVTMQTDSNGNIVGPGEAVIPGQVTPKPMDMYSTNPSDKAVGAGINPALMKFSLHRHLPFNGLFSTEGYGESKENTPIHEQPGLVLQNAMQYGDKGLDYIKDYVDLTYRGRPPSRDWNRVPKMSSMYGPSNFENWKGGLSGYFNQKRDQFKTWESGNAKMWRQLQEDYNRGIRPRKGRGY